MEGPPINAPLYTTCPCIVARAFASFETKNLRSSFFEFHKSLIHTNTNTWMVI